MVGLQELLKLRDGFPEGIIGIFPEGAAVPLVKNLGMAQGTFHDPPVLHLQLPQEPEGIHIVLEAHGVNAGGQKLPIQRVPSRYNVVDRSLAHMTKGRMADIVSQGDGIHQIQVCQLLRQGAVELPADIPGDDLHLDGMGQSGSDLPPGCGIKQLGFVLHIAKLRRRDDFLYVGIVDFHI